MQLATILSALAVSTSWLPVAAGDAEFLQVARKESVDHSNRATDPANKYFRKYLQEWRHFTPFLTVHVTDYSY